MYKLSELANLLGVDKTRTTPYHPQSDRHLGQYVIHNGGGGSARLGFTATLSGSSVLHYSPPHYWVYSQLPGTWAKNNLTSGYYVRGGWEGTEFPGDVQERMRATFLMSYQKLGQVASWQKVYLTKVYVPRVTR